MKRFLPLVVLAVSSGAFAQTPDAFQDLRRYDYQDRKAVDSITKQIQAGGKVQLLAIETELIKVLEDPQTTLAGKQEACSLLWRIGTGRSVPALAKLLGSSQTSNLARLALERNTDPAAGGALRAALGTTKGTELVGVINSVGNRGDDQAVTTLRVLAADADPLVAEAAIIALGKVGTVSAIVALRNHPKPTPAVHIAVLRAVDKLAASGKRTDAIGFYEGMTKPAFDPVIRAGALTGLAALGAPNTGKAALSLAQTAPEPILQRVAGRVAGLLSSVGDTKAAITAFPTLPPTAQVALLTAWADRREKAAAPVALGALKSADADVRVAAIQTAGKLGELSAVMPLAVLAEQGEHAGEARQALARMSGPGVEAALIRLATNGPGGIPNALVSVLGERPTAATTIALVQLVQGQQGPGETRVIVSALKVLGRTASVAQESALVDVLVKTNAEAVRDAAQSAIVAIAQRTGDRNRAAAPLLAAFSPATSSGKAAIVAALAEVGGSQALDIIAKATASTDETVRSAAIASLANAWADTSALPALLQVAKSASGKSDRVVALRGYLRLVQSDERAAADLRLSRVTDALAAAERPEEKRQALSVLREVRLPGAVVLAAKALDTPELASDAAETIFYLAAPQKKDQTNFPAVQGPELQAALEKVIRTVQDEGVRAMARKLQQR